MSKVKSLKNHLLLSLWYFCIVSIGFVKGEAGKITITDKSISFSPRLFGRSAVAYKDRMYVYGGKHAALVAHSNDMYEYIFDTPNNEKATMSLVNGTNKGPSCSFCGAVMIDESHMMILSHEYANAWINSTESRTVVRPYIFDFVSLTWTQKEVPSYNKSEENLYYMRAKHSTVLGSDGRIYVIGGTNFFEDTTPLTESYYYDPVLNHYGKINNNGFEYKSIGPTAFNLPDGNIGSVFGRIGATGEYNWYDTMMVLDTKTSTWIKNQTLSSSPLNTIPLKREYIEGATVQLIPNTNFAVFLGTAPAYKDQLVSDNEPEIMMIKRLAGYAKNIKTRDLIPDTKGLIPGNTLFSPWLVSTKFYSRISQKYEDKRFDTR
ncbi:uncharacterized protein EV154DRAFT_510009 [Mucor mucedo]|uniref:uncharacterized protein n=1 Tax=Mucor mucedo TaxID=29922 RepID=UPI00221FD8A4|nr:uncharacterized protein EV154DRAFT_510009 [Mucor mucedo]KAI7890926.1 hypothetical protein EV154DRAFT_510009 [Mucor mucedo]